MITDFAWIGQVDHRISSAIVFFLLVPLLNTAHLKPRYPLRILLSFVLMCIGSFVTRYMADALTVSPMLRGLFYSLQLLSLYALFLFATWLCYKVHLPEQLYLGLLALTIYKIAWNSFKSVSSLMLVNHVDAPWSRYSIAGSLVSYLVYLVICLLCSFIYKKKVKEPPYHAPVHVLMILSLIFVSCFMILEFCGQVFTAESAALFLYYFCALLYTILNFAALLMIAMLDNFRHENRTMHDFISNKMRYYEMSHDGILALQTKCHDLKHQIAAIRSQAGKEQFDSYLSELEDSINEYSTVIECGNQTVDIVLTEKNILCLSSHVKFSYMIDGSLFSFLSDREIYSLFGNALDNALEATTKLSDIGDRMITLKANRRGDLVVLQVENTCEPGFSLDGDILPQTTKSGKGHGFGLRSISRLAEKHGGSMSVRAENGVFKLSVILHP